MMNNDLEQFSEERLQRYINQFAEDGMCDITDDEIMPLIRIALVAKQAVPAGYLEDGKGFMYEPRHKDRISNPVAAYLVPPANSPAVPDGWKLVPIEPTDAMKKAYYDSSLAPISKLSVMGYRALIAAAPKPESE